MNTKYVSDVFVYIFRYHFTFYYYCVQLVQQSCFQGSSQTPLYGRNHLGKLLTFLRATVTANSINSVLCLFNIFMNSIEI